MKLTAHKIFFPLFILLSVTSSFYFFFETSKYHEFTSEGCTIGVVSASSTSDNRPLLWKVRDNSDLPNNQLVYDTTCLYSFIAIVNNGDTSVWMGVNEKGLSIVNSTSKDLPATGSGYSNGTLMRAALGYCRTVQDFEELLLITNEEGRKTRANFALIDSTGAAVIFETSGNEFWKFDADNPKQAPGGYLIRTNFSVTGGGNEGIQRYNRTGALIESLYIQNNLNYESIIKNHLRDFSDAQSNHIEIPYMNRWASNKPFGYINSNYSVCRSISVSASVFRGVKASEPAKYTTMWTTIGQPASTITLPFWSVGDTPALTHGEIISPIFRAANEIKSELFDDNDPTYLDTYKLRDDLDNGILNNFLSVENLIIRKVEEIFYNGNKPLPDNDELLLIENELCESVYSELMETRSKLSSLIKLIVWNNDPYNFYNDNNFRDGCIIHLIDAGDNGKIDPPIDDPVSGNYGMPGGDDKLVGRSHFLGENTEKRNRFYFPVMLWHDAADLPHAGDRIYLRVFNSDVLADAEYYGEAQLFNIQERNIQEYLPEILRIKTIRHEDNTDNIVSLNPGKKDFKLYQNYPNPFNPVTIIKFEIPRLSGDEKLNVELKVYDILGREVSTLISDAKPGGSYEVEFSAKGGDAYVLSSGIYIYQLRAGEFEQKRKMILLR